jgi:hypothetical protein
MSADIGYIARNVYVPRESESLDRVGFITRIQICNELIRCLALSWNVLPVLLLDFNVARRQRQLLLTMSISHGRLQFKVMQHRRTDLGSQRSVLMFESMFNFDVFTYRFSRQSTDSIDFSVTLFIVGVMLV